MKNCFSILLIIFIFIAFSSALFFFNLRASLLNPRLIKSSLSDNGAYEKFLTKSLPDLLQSSLQGGQNKGVSQNLFADIGEKIVTPKNLQTDVETSLDNILPYLSGKASSLNFSLDLSKYRQGITANFRPTVEKYLATLPVCTQKELSQPTEGLPTCRTPNLSPAQFYDQIGASEAEANFESNIPNKIIFAENNISFDPPIQKKVDTQSGKNFDIQNIKLSQVKQSLSGSNVFILASFLFGLLLVGILFVLWGKKFRTSLTFFSWALAGFVFFLPAGLIVFLKNPNSNAISVFGPDWIWLSDSIYSFVRGFLTPLFWESVVIIVIAIGILVSLRFILKSKPIELTKPS